MERTRTSGFTLVELIVSVGLFSIVVVIAMSAYLALISLDRKARATNDIMTNLSFVMESMSRNIRTGTTFDCGGLGTPVPMNCSGGSNSFSFIDENGQVDTYLLNTTDGTIRTCQNTSACTANGATVLTDPRINVTKLTFYTRGAPRGDGFQPNVIFVISGNINPYPADPNSVPVSFTIEGGATQRILDL